jgi:hypothetical protein
MKIKVNEYCNRSLNVMMVMDENEVRNNSEVKKNVFSDIFFKFFQN